MAAFSSKRPSEPSTPPAVHRDKVVFLVDSDETFRGECAKVLQANNYSITEASDSRVALALALSQPPFAVVTVNRPAGFNGEELCRLLRGDSATRHTRTLLLTDTPPAAPARRGPVDYVLSKPATPQAVCEQLERLALESSQPTAAERPAAPAQPKRARRRISEMRSRRLTEPPRHPPVVHCRDCGDRLQYKHSFLSGANLQRPDQWDLFSCPEGCGTFLWRHRSRQLTRADHLHF